jgi:hypothetical protein
LTVGELRAMLREALILASELLDAVRELTHELRRANGRR